MPVRNFLAAPLEDLPRCHGGGGVLRHVSLFQEGDFQSGLRFLNYTVLPPGASIGLHRHGDDEEIYVVLQGKGIMTVDGEAREVAAGDVILNSPLGEHGLINNAAEDLRILVFEVGRQRMQ